MKTKITLNNKFKINQTRNGEKIRCEMRVNQMQKMEEKESQKLKIKFQEAQGKIILTGI